MLSKMRPKARSALYGVIAAFLLFLIVVTLLSVLPADTGLFRENTLLSVTVPEVTPVKTTARRPLPRNETSDPRVLNVPPEETIVDMEARQRVTSSEKKVTAEPEIEKDLPPATGETEPPRVTSDALSEETNPPVQAAEAPPVQERPIEPRPKKDLNKDQAATQSKAQDSPELKPEKSKEKSKEKLNKEQSQRATQTDDEDMRPRIAIVIQQMGLSRGATSNALQMPSAISFIFAPYASDVHIWAQKARAAGHEYMISLPMEPVTYPEDDPGPNALLTALSDQENISRLNWALSKTSGYEGVATKMGGQFVTQEAKLSPILDQLLKRDLMILDTNRSADSLLPSLARIKGVSYLSVDREIDSIAARSEIDAQLLALEEIARKNGQAIGLAFPYPVTFERLRAWIPSLKKKGLILEPISSLNIY